MNKKAIIEAIKEVLRLMFFAAIAAAVSWGMTQITNLPADSVYAIVGTVVLRAIDKWVHENKDVKASGLAPF